MQSHKQIIDLYAPAAPESGMRCKRIIKDGLFRLSRRDSAVYSVQIISNATWGRARVMNGAGEMLWYQPSVFTGSFWLDGFAKGGILVEVIGASSNYTINWREKDNQIV